MDIFEEIVEYKKNIKEAAKLFAMVSVMNTQTNEAFDKLIPIMQKIQNLPLATTENKKDLEFIVDTLKLQQSINATASSVYCQTAMELNKLLKELEVGE